jgi:transposase
MSMSVSKRPRRSWSDDAKQRIVAEALLPGASVADVARRHGVNANFLFSWRRSALTAGAVGVEVTATSEPAQPEVVPMVSDAGFIPIGVFTRTADGGPALIAGARQAEPPPSPTARVRADVDKRAGLIEIDLADGTRLQVDAFANERALQRVLSALKAAS